jgi:TetR/AcrR family transcriptional regulator, regulator of autoinduction and epiphytic fitness
MALANHRKVIGAELKAYAERVRDIETAAATVALRAHGVDLDEYPPVVVSMLLAQMARSMCNEVAIGVTDGHQQMRDFVERFLAQYGASAPSGGTR